MTDLFYESKEFQHILDIENEYYEFLYSKCKLVVPIEDQPNKVAIIDMDEYEKFDVLCQKTFSQFMSKLAIYSNNINNPDLQQIARYFDNRQQSSTGDNIKRTTILSRLPCVVSPIVDYQYRDKTKCKYELWAILARNSKEHDYMAKRDGGYDWSNSYDRSINFTRLCETGIPVLIGEKTNDDDVDIQQQLNKMCVKK